MIIKCLIILLLIASPVIAHDSHPEFTPDGTVQCVPDAVTAAPDWGEINKPIPSDAILNSPVKLNYDEALEFCSGGWRLPTFEELAAMDGDELLTDFAYWTSKVDNRRNHPHYVFFANGNAAWYRAAYKINTLCVR